MVAVYPGGIVIKPVLMKESTILASEIRETVVKRGLFGSRVEVHHDAVDSISPFFVDGSGDTALVRAIRAIAATAAPATQGAQPPKGPELGRDALPGSAILGRSLADGGTAGAVLASLGLFGVVVSVVLVVVGIIWAIPNFGLFGVLWTGYAGFIALVNTRRFLAGK
jgi:hypothetical protein